MYDPEMDESLARYLLQLNIIESSDSLSQKFDICLLLF